MQFLCLRACVCFKRWILILFKISCRSPLVWFTFRLGFGGPVWIESVLLSLVMFQSEKESNTSRYCCCCCFFLIMYVRTNGVHFLDWSKIFMSFPSIALATWWCVCADQVKPIYFMSIALDWMFARVNAKHTHGEKEEERERWRSKGRNDFEKKKQQQCSVYFCTVHRAT